MAQFLYTPNVAEFERILAAIQTAGVPAKVDTPTLTAFGSSSSTASYNMRCLRGLGFLDADSVPTELWKRYRGTKTAPRALGEGIRLAYADLFALFPNAHQRDESVIQQYITQRTKVSKGTIEHMTRFFTRMCTLADFSDEAAADSPSPTPQTKPAQSPENAHSNSAAVLPSNNIPSLHIDIQIHISPDASLAQIDAIFSSLAKNFGNPA